MERSNCDRNGAHRLKGCVSASQNHQPKFYDRQLNFAQQTGFDEILFLNESAQLTEGAISNFFFRIDGKWKTPELSCGLLPGILRASILTSRDDAVECELKITDIRRADSIFCCNVLRGVRMVHSLHNTDGSIVWDLYSKSGAAHEPNLNMPARTMLFDMTRLARWRPLCLGRITVSLEFIGRGQKTSLHFAP